MLAVAKRLERTGARTDTAGAAGRGNTPFKSRPCAGGHRVTAPTPYACVLQQLRLMEHISNYHIKPLNPHKPQRAIYWYQNRWPLACRCEPLLSMDLPSKATTQMLGRRWLCFLLSNSWGKTARPHGSHFKDTIGLPMSMTLYSTCRPLSHQTAPLLSHGPSVLPAADPKGCGPDLQVPYNAPAAVGAQHQEGPVQVLRGLGGTGAVQQHAVRVGIREQRPEPLLNKQHRRFGLPRRVRRVARGAGPAAVVGVKGAPQAPAAVGHAGLVQRRVVGEAARDADPVDVDTQPRLGGQDLVGVVHDSEGARRAPQKVGVVVG